MRAPLEGTVEQRHPRDRVAHAGLRQSQGQRAIDISLSLSFIMKNTKQSVRQKRRDTGDDTMQFTRTEYAH